jgi:hypothetical protein
MFKKGLSVSVFLVSITLFLYRNVLVAKLSLWQVWNGLRVAVAVGWGRGFGYFHDIGDGPAVNIIYGPMSSVFFLPSAWFHNPTSAVVCASVINMALFCIPLCCVCFALVKGDLFKKWVCIVFCLACSFRNTATMWIFQRISADAPAVSLGLLSCFFMYRAFLKSKFSYVYEILASLCVVLAVWSKQIEVSIFFAQMAFLWINQEKKLLKRYFVICCVVGGFVGFFWVVLLGYRSLYFNMFDVPMKHGFIDGGHGIWGMMLVHVYSAYRLWSVFFLCVCIGFFQSRKKNILYVKSIKSHPSVLFMISAFFLLPTGALANMKVGGAINSAHGHYYFLVCIFCLVLFVMENSSSWMPVFLVSFFSCALLFPTEQILSVVSKPWLSNPAQKAYEYVLKNPDEGVYFPLHPLASLMAVGKLYHHTVVLSEIEMAGCPISEQYFQKYIPKNIHAVAVYDREDYWNDSVFKWFPLFVKKEKTPYTMEGWSFYIKP